MLYQYKYIATVLVLLLVPVRVNAHNEKIAKEMYLETVLPND
jgi:hypothetical protein